MASCSDRAACGKRLTATSRQKSEDLQSVVLSKLAFMIARIPFCYLRNDRVMFAFAEGLKGMLQKSLALAPMPSLEQKNMGDA